MPDTVTPDQYCEDKAAKSGSSFITAFAFARRPPPGGDRFNAFCREVDDVVDECHEERVARLKLAWWRSEVERLYAGAPEHPVGQALLPHVRALDLPQGPAAGNHRRHGNGSRPGALRQFS